MKRSLILSTGILALSLIETIIGAETEALYDNLDELLGFRGRSIFQTPEVKGFLAQPFVTGEHGTICSIAFPVARLGSPSGTVPVEIWDDEDGRPGKKVETVGEFELSELTPAEEGGEILRFDINVSGLDRDSIYYLVTDDTNTDVSGGSKSYLVQTAPGNEGAKSAGKFLAFGQIDDDWVVIDDESAGRTYRIMEVFECPPASTYSLTIPELTNGTVSVDPEKEAYPADEEITLTATPSEGFQFVKWISGEEEITDNPYIFTIESDTTITPEFDEIFQFAIPEVEGGTVTSAPAEGPFLVGTTISVSAEPEEGFEFVNWTYGEEEYATNPATITIQEGATLVPVFAAIAITKPLQVDIEHAVAISWDSQADKIYQIHASNDMETWEIAIDAIEGTGERLTQCFVREETEIFYRVEERP